MKIITVTDAALKELKKMARRNGPETSGVRFGVKAGGCSGFEYVLKPITSADERHDDYVLFLGELRICINSKNIPYVEGTTIDRNLIGFMFQNPKAGISCGCGTSFQIKETKSP